MTSSDLSPVTRSPLSKSKTHVTKILTLGSPKLLASPPLAEDRRSSLNFPFFKGLLNGPDQLKTEDESSSNVVDPTNLKSQQGNLSPLNRPSLQSPKDAARASPNLLAKDSNMKNLNFITVTQENRSSRTSPKSESFDGSFVFQQEKVSANKMLLLKMNDKPGSKRNLLDLSQSSATGNRAIATKQASFKLKNRPSVGTPKARANEVFFDLSGEIPRNEGLFSTTIRRRSCHCSDCGGLSKLEKKHVNIVIPCKRVQNRNSPYLSLRYSDFIGNMGRLPSESTPLSRGTKYSQDFSPSISTGMPTPNQRKFVTLIEKEKSSNLSTFARNMNKNRPGEIDLDKRQAEPLSKTEVRTPKPSVGVPKEEDGEDEKSPTLSLKSRRLKSPTDILTNLRRSEENLSPPLQHLNILDSDRGNKRNSHANRSTPADSLIVTESSPTTIASPSITKGESYRKEKPKNLTAPCNSMQASRQSLILARFKSVNEPKKNYVEAFASKVQRIKKRPKQLKLSNACILETYTNLVKASSSPVNKNSSKGNLFKSSQDSPWFKGSENTPVSTQRSKPCILIGQQKSMHKSEITLKTIFPTITSPTERSKDTRNGKEDSQHGRLKKLETSEKNQRRKNISELNQIVRGASLPKDDMVLEEPKKKAFKTKHRRNISNPVGLEELKKTYQWTKNVGFLQKGREM